MDINFFFFFSLPPSHQTTEFDEYYKSQNLDKVHNDVEICIRNSSKPHFKF